MWLIKKSYWLRTFWPVSQEPEFSQIWDLCSNTANNINFHYRTNPAKTNDKIFQYIQKTCFWPIFPIFGAKTFFLENSALSCTIGFQHHAKIQKKKNIIPRKMPRQTEGWTEGWMEGRKGRQTLFHRTLPTNAGGKKKSWNYQCLIL